ncbi:MAG: YceI family protein [Bacteroidetes bacterium]|nr:YceI family protein [Bacteroidota bacterium]MBU1116913.1 YceI family protein [Bacteroidota bacterium]MBU1798342.1 YceI family protein [Bacteroidota bacterium]
MKNINKLIVVLALLSSTVFAQTKWNFDTAHSEVGFSVTHMLISETDGFFKEYIGSVVSTSDDFQNAEIKFEAKAASIFTDNEKRDKHLVSPDFFDAEKFPTLTFNGKSFTKVDDKNYKLVGDLTIKGVTKEVTLDVKYNGTINDPWGNTRAGFKITGEVDRFPFGLTWNAALETGGLVVSKEVALNIKIELIKEK